MSQAQAPADRDLSDVLSDWREDAAILRRRGDARAADLLLQCATDVAGVAEEYTSWLSEAEAQLRSGWTAGQVRRHARAFLHTPHVQAERRAYRLRACIVPRRAHYELLRAAAERGAA
jgi:hypothetical protein